MFLLCFHNQYQFYGGGSAWETCAVSYSFQQILYSWVILVITETSKNLQQVCWANIFKFKHFQGISSTCTARHRVWREERKNLFHHSCICYMANTMTALNTNPIFHWITAENVHNDLIRMNVRLQTESLCFTCEMRIIPPITSDWSCLTLIINSIFRTTVGTTLNLSSGVCLVIRRTNIMVCSQSKIDL